MFQSVERDNRTYLLHSKLASYQKRVDAAIATARTALALAKKPLLSFSAGKDSVVLLDIAVKAGFHGDLLFFKYGIFTDVETPPENTELLKYYAAKHGLKYHILDCFGEVDCWEQCGRFVLFPETAKEKRIFNRTNMDFFGKSKAFCRENGVDLQLIGMRKAESARRKAMLNKKGPIYTVKSRDSLTCCPLENLTSEDIWAYIFSNGLKYLSIYDYPYIDRRRNRDEITMLYNDELIRRGMIFHYKKMYPEFFTWLKERWGDVV